MSKKHTPEHFYREVEMNLASASIHYSVSSTHKPITQALLVFETLTTSMAIAATPEALEKLALEIRATLEEISIHNFLIPSEAREEIERRKAKKARKASE